jgi:hypothetical protein
MPNITPGPWTAQQDCRSEKNNGIFTGENPDQYGNQNMWGIYGSHFRIAEVYEANQFEGITQDQVNANAHLMAAAPDLLEIAETFMRMSETILKKDTVDSNTLKTALGFYIPTITAAIKKAQGEINND